MSKPIQMVTDPEGRVWVWRNAEGKIGKASSSKQPGEGWESMSPDDPELLEFQEVVEDQLRRLKRKFPDEERRSAAIEQFIKTTRGSDDPLN